MRTKSLIMLCCFLCVTLTPCIRSVAQGGGDRDRPGGPGNPAVPGGAAGVHQPHHADREKERVTTAPRNALQFGPVGRWWDNKSVVQAVGLRKDQQKRMDDIFNANKPAILDSYKTFLKAQANLAAVNKNPSADQATMFAAIDAVNQARSSLQKATSAMLLQIRKEMDPDQITKLETVK